MQKLYWGLSNKNNIYTFLVKTESVFSSPPCLDCSRVHPILMGPYWGTGGSFLERPGREPGSLAPILKLKIRIFATPFPLCLHGLTLL